MLARALFSVTAAFGLAVGGAAGEANPFTPGTRAAESASDSFERSVLGSSWNVHAGNPGIVSGSNLGLLSGSLAILSWAAPLAADQFSEAEVAAGIDPRMQRQVFVRRRASDSARYALHYNLGVSPERWELKYDGVLPSQTRRLATASTPPGPVPGDVIRIEAEGDALRGYKNGRLIIQANDTSTQRITAGAPGMSFVLIGDSVVRPSPVFERWAGGALAPPEPKIVRFSRSGSLVLYSTVRPACFSVRLVANARVQHTFTVTNARKRVVWKNVGVSEASGSRLIQWCGRTKAKTPRQGKPLPVGKYRASLEVSAAPAGKRPGPAVFFARNWPLTIRTAVVTRRFKVSKDVRSSRPVTTGKCQATPSSQVAGWRLRCLGEPGATARIVIAIPVGRASFLSVVLGKVKVDGIGSYSSATAAIRRTGTDGPRIIVTVIVSGRKSLDIARVTVPVVIRFRR